jgi:Fe-Mn family superoxide dismutase
MLSRRTALKQITLTSAAALTGQWTGNARAQSNGTSELVAAPFVLPPLPFAPEALEPHVDAETMRIHHGKHHAAYVKNLNLALESHPDLKSKPLEDLLRDLNDLPRDIFTSVRNNGGGHSNHSLFWQCLSPKGGGRPQGELMEQMAATFGSFEAMQEKMTASALGCFGSGWAWLSLNEDRTLAVENLPNQDSPLMYGRHPLFGIDVWEHAYYLRYQNRRADYVKAIWNVVDWQFVAGRYVELIEA